MKQNGVIKIVDSDGILQLSEKHIEEELYHENCQMTIFQIIENIDMDQQMNQKNNPREFLQTKSQQ